jgi:uncharacterized protein with GYD domain
VHHGEIPRSGFLYGRRSQRTSQGRRHEAFYFAFGETDTFVIVDVPDSVSIAALSLAFSASGRGRIRTTALVTPAEIDEAVKRKIAYRAPGE